MEMMTELEQRERELAAAIQTGKAEAIRSAQQQRQASALKQQRATEAILASRRLGPTAPGAGEEKRLAAEERAARIKLDRLNATRTNDLAVLVGQPESESLLAKIEDADAQISATQRILEGIHVRQAQIAEWHEHQRRKAEDAAEERAIKVRDAERLRLEKVAGAMGQNIPARWRKLLKSLDELDRVEAKLKELSGLKNSCPPTDTVRAEIEKRTGKAIRFIEGDNPRIPRETRIAFTCGGRDRPLIHSAFPNSRGVE